MGGYFYHVLNRANGRAPIFMKDADYDAFLRITFSYRFVYSSLMLMVNTKEVQQWNVTMLMKNRFLIDFWTNRCMVHLEHHYIVVRYAMNVNI